MLLGFLFVFCCFLWVFFGGVSFFFIHHLNLHYLAILQHQYYQYYINKVYNQNHSYYEPIQVFVNVSSIHRSTRINRTDQMLKLMKNENDSYRKQLEFVIV